MAPILEEPSLLFGGYIEKASFNVGYGSQSSTAQITIVYEHDGPKATEDFTLRFPALGTCVGVKFGELEFIGMLQKWTESKDLGGYRYDIILESPSKILDGVNIILSEFQGNAYPLFLGTFTTQISNTWNIFAQLENFAYGGIFGGANTNSAGFPGLVGLTLMEAASRGELDFGGPIMYGDSQYYLDLSELKQIISSLSNPELYRIDGQAKSVSAIIDEACSLVMYDYIVEFVPREGKITTGVMGDCNIIIRMIDKSRPPDLNVIRGAIKKYEQDGELISSSFGRELMNTVTQKLVIGAPATRYVHTDKGQLKQIWGRTKGVKPEYSSRICLDDGRLYPPSPNDRVTVLTQIETKPDPEPDIMEVRAAVHSFDSWILYHVFRRYLLSKATSLEAKEKYGNEIIDKYASFIFTDATVNDFVLNRIADGTYTAMHLIDTSIDAAKKRNLVTSGTYIYEELQKIHAAIKGAGEEYWGRKYWVTLPAEIGGKANNIKFTSEDFQYINSWEMADSAWHEYPTPYSDVSFYDGDGKLKTSATWKFVPDKYDYTNLGNGYCFGTKGGISSVVNVEKDIYWIKDKPTDVGVPKCVIDLPAVAVFDQYTTEHNALYHFMKIYFGYSDKALAGMFGVGAEVASTIYGISPDRAKPEMVGIAQVSTRYRWGPWYNYKTLKGASEVIVEESLSPETFGGIDNMGAFGSNYAYVANAEVTGVESGSIELAGMPVGTIGRRFLVSGPYVTGIDVNVGIGGVTTSYKLNTWTPQFGKLAKYNADRFANLNKNLFRFTQDKRSKLEARPFQPQVYKDRWFKNNRPGFLNQGGASMLGIQIKSAGLPGSEAFQTNVQQGAPINQVNAVAADPLVAHACSLEQVYTPVLVAKIPDPEDVGKKPTFQAPTDNYTAFSKMPDSKLLNPYFTHEKNDYNHTVMNKGEVKHLSVKQSKEEGDELKSVQTVGFRGPMMLSGWGVSSDMKKVPFKDDINEYHEDVGTNRNLWKSGPIDHRWDEERKNWGCGFDFVRGFLKTNMTGAISKTEPTTFKVDVYRNQDMTIEASGISKNVKEIKWLSTGEEITGINRTKSTGSAGDYIVLMRVDYEWGPIYVDC
jgi:hypothetical protein